MLHPAFFLGRNFSTKQPKKSPRGKIYIKKEIFHHIENSKK
jgi:hypothetical protein